MKNKFESFIGWVSAFWVTLQPLVCFFFMKVSKVFFAWSVMRCQLIYWYVRDTQNGWLAFNTCREKNLESCTLQKQAFLANTWCQCFACCSKRICQISIILVQCIECSSTFSLRPRKLEMFKAWNNKDVLITFSMCVRTFKTAYGWEKNSQD